MVGLGRIGLPIAALCLHRGHHVVGVDIDRSVLRRISDNELGYVEPGLDVEGLHVSAEVPAHTADIGVICVGTTRSRTLDDTAVHAAADALMAQASPALLIVVSTVNPTTCAAVAERLRVDVAHAPERSRPGEAIAGLATIPRLVGGVTQRATKAAISFWSTLTDAPLLACDAAEAALAKLAENAEREVRIAFANELADAAVHLGLDPDRVSSLTRSHPRSALLQHGVGVGGTCLPMATRWFATRADGVAAAARAMHDRRPDVLAARIAAQLPRGAKVCVLGRTYRPNVRYDQDESDAYDSPATALITALEAHDLQVTSWDPADEIGSRAEAEAGADLVIIAVPHDELQ